ncbi:MAG: FecR protein [Pseudomonadota bacterium]
MRARVQPEVEPLSRVAWDRIEAQLFERLEHGEHRRPAFVDSSKRAPLRLWAGVALAAAAVLALWLQYAPASSSEVSTVTPVASGVASGVTSGVTRFATTDAPASTMLGETTLLLAPHSEVLIAGSDAGGWLVQLGLGEVGCEVAPRRGRPPFVVQAGETRVTVVGTRFTVQREGLAARVHVREGHVRVQSGGAEELLGPGDSWPSGGGPSEPPVVSSAALPEVQAAPVAPLPTRARVSARRHERGTDAAAQFAKAARLEATAPDAASAVYRELAAGRGPWAANALYAQARLAGERGRTQLAVRLLRRYRLRYPRGANAADVDAQLQRIAASTGGGAPPPQPGSAAARPAGALPH